MAKLNLINSHKLRKSYSREQGTGNREQGTGNRVESHESV
jgi:hypothetical protein